MSRPRFTRVAAAAALLVGLVSAVLLPSPADAAYTDVVVVANRASGDLSVIHTQSLKETRIDLPGNAEPMYVNQDRRNGLVLVGDRAASKIVALDQNTFEVVGSVAVGAGVFHQWHDEQSGKLWVVGDTSKTVTVVDTTTMSVVATINMPADLVAAGGKPHDVFVAGNNAFVSFLGFDNGDGVVVQYSTSSLAETRRISVGDDPHLFVSGAHLYVASQGASTISRHSTTTLATVGSATVPSAHGLYVADSGHVLVTNIAGGGDQALYQLNRTLSSVGSTADTDFPTPHNVTVDANGQAWVTHSGGAAKHVSIIELSAGGLGHATTIEVGTNPFGLAFIDR